MKKIKLKIKQIPFLFSVIFFVFSIFVFYFAFKEVNKINSLAIEVEKNFQLEKLKRQNLFLLMKTIERTENQRAEIGKHFVYGDDIVPFLNFIEELGPKVGIEVDVDSVDLLKDGSGLLMNLKTNGSFESIYKFLSLIENSKYELKVLDMNLSQEQNEQSLTKNWRAEFKLKLVSFIP